MKENKTLYKIAKAIYSKMLKIIYRPTVKGTENIVEIEYETNASAQKICIEASDKNGSSKIECDEETVKVDKEPIKITKTQESIEIVEGKSK